MKVTELTRPQVDRWMSNWRFNVWKPALEKLSNDGASSASPAAAPGASQAEGKAAGGFEGKGKAKPKTKPKVKAKISPVNADVDESSSPPSTAPHEPSAPLAAVESASVSAERGDDSRTNVTFPLSDAEALAALLADDMYSVTASCPAHGDDNASRMTDEVPAPAPSACRGLYVRPHGAAAAVRDVQIRNSSTSATARALPRHGTAHSWHAAEGRVVPFGPPPLLGSSTSSSSSASVGGGQSRPSALQAGTLRGWLAQGGRNLHPHGLPTAHVRAAEEVNGGLDPRCSNSSSVLTASAPPSAGLPGQALQQPSALPPPQWHLNPQSGLSATPPGNPTRLPPHAHGPPQQPPE